MIFMIDSTQTFVLYRIVLAFHSISHSQWLALEATPTIKYLNRALSLVNV